MKEIFNIKFQGQILMTIMARDSRSARNIFNGSFSVKKRREARK